MRSDRAFYAFLPRGCARVVMALLPLFLSDTSRAQQIPVNYDESKVGTYTLPDPLTLENGARVRDAGSWYRQR